MHDGYNYVHSYTQCIMGMPEQEKQENLKQLMIR